mgnify:CR=1 FL=1
MRERFKGEAKERIQWACLLYIKSPGKASTSPGLKHVYTVRSIPLKKALISLKLSSPLSS